MISRRAALGGLGALALPPRLLATSPMLPPVKTEAARFEQGGWARMSAPANSGVEVLFEGKAIPRDDMGRFLIAFDRDAAPFTFVEYSTMGLPLTIAPRAWRIEHVDAPFHPPAMPDETFVQIRKEELARITAARAHASDAQGWRQNFLWPGKARLSGLFGSQRTYRGGVSGSYHSGADIALSGGTTYVAPAEGIVTLAADHPFTLEGNLLMLDHGMGLSSAFLHSSALLVKEGDRVAQGQPIGKVGMSGRATGPHLHWSLRWREARLDPMLFTGPMA